MKFTWEEIKKDPDRYFDQYLDKPVETKQDAEDRVEAFKNYLKAYQEKADELKILNEYLVLIQKFDIKRLNTFLITPKTDNAYAVKKSWIGKLLRVSEIDSLDEIAEAKKQLARVGDILSIQEDATWSLNIPGYYNLWATGVGNFLTVDTSVDLVEIVRSAAMRNVRD